MIQNLPFELIKEITKYLDIRSYLRFRIVNKAMASLLEQRPVLYLSALKVSFRQLKHILSNPTTPLQDSNNIPQATFQYPDPSLHLKIDNSEVFNFNAFQFLCRFGFKEEFSRLLKLNSIQGRHLSIQQLEILMGIATDGVYDSKTSYLHLDDDFAYHQDVVWELVNYLPYAYTKSVKNKKCPRQEPIIEATIVLSSSSEPPPFLATAAGPSTTEGKSKPVRVKKTFDNHWRIMQLITIACFQDDLRLFKHLAPRLFQHPKELYIPLLNCALAKASNNCAMWILNNWPDIDPSKDENTLTIASQKGDQEIVNRLLQFSDVVPNLTCALASMTCNHLAVFEILLANPRANLAIHANALFGKPIFPFSHFFPKVRRFTWTELKCFKS